MNDLFPSEIIERVITYTDQGITSKVCKLWLGLCKLDKCKKINVSSISTIDLYQWAISLGLAFSSDVQWYLVKNGCKSVMQAIYGKSRVSYYLYNATINHTNINLAKWLRKHEAPWNSLVFKRAIKAGNLKLIRFLRKYGCPYDDIKIEVLMIKSGNPEIIQYFIKRGYTIPKNCMTIAANDIKMLTWLHQLLADFSDYAIKPDALVRAIKHGNMTCIRYIQSINKFTDFQQILIEAVHDINIFLYLFDDYVKNYELILEMAMKLDSVQVFINVYYYSKLEKEQLIIDAMDAKAVKIVQYLIETYEFNSTKIFDFCYHNLPLLKIYCRKNKGKILLNSITTITNFMNCPNLFYLLKKRILTESIVLKIRSDNMRIIIYSQTRYGLRPCEENILKLYKVERYSELCKILNLLIDSK